MDSTALGFFWEGALKGFEGFEGFKGLVSFSSTSSWRTILTTFDYFGERRTQNKRVGIFYLYPNSTQIWRDSTKTPQELV